MQQQVKNVLNILLTEAAFLVDIRVQENLKGMPDAESATYKVITTCLSSIPFIRTTYECWLVLVQSDNLLTALGVEDREDLDELVSCFYEYDHSFTACTPLYCGNAYCLMVHAWPH
jgi:hypothetical protein